ncbi:MAG: (Fe-S)-binding protein [Spirochaetes bacterium]|nr:(Fe-S)-binding protein [Spirochaetota bacterium]
MSREFYYTERCLQCGICTNSCPYSYLPGSGFTPRNFIQKVRLGLIDFSKDDLWYCTNCNSCVNSCPFEIPFVDVMVDLRGLVYENGAGYIPESLRFAINASVSHHNPWQENEAARGDWFRNTSDVPKGLGADGPVLLYAGCFASYDSHGKKTARAAAELLQRAGVAFEILGEEEACCGDSVRRCGNTNGFEKLKNHNMSGFRRKGARRIYTLSPHCYDAISRYYCGDSYGDISIQPYVTVLNEKIRDGTLKLTKPVNKKITFHDPCFFAKHNDYTGMFRQILGAIPGVEFTEMEHNGSRGICCGGGGGGAFLDRPKGERLADVRLDEALKTGAELLVTACPICVNMLESSALGDPKYEALRVIDLGELIVSCI